MHGAHVQAIAKSIGSYNSKHERSLVRKAKSTVLLWQKLTLTITLATVTLVTPLTPLT